MLSTALKYAYNLIGTKNPTLKLASVVGETSRNCNKQKYNALPITGRFFAIDPLALKFPWWTPYQFAGLTPIWARELEELEPWINQETNDVIFEPYSDEYTNEIGYEPAAEIDVLIYHENNMPIVDGGKLAGHVMAGFPFIGEKRLINIL